MNENNVWIQSDATDIDFTVPSNIEELPAGVGPSVLWAPRSAKVDTAVLLRRGLDSLGLTKDKVAIITTGAFKSGMMRDPQFNERSVVVIQRAGDSARREALGELVDLYTREQLEGFATGTPAVQDPEGRLALMAEYSTLVIKDQLSDESIEIFLFDENAQRIELLYLVIKTIMFAATREFMETLGYTEVLRTNGSDNATLETQGEGGVFAIHGRTMTYRMSHRDFLAGIDALAQLIIETYTVTSPIDNSDTTATESAYIGDGGI